MTAKYERVIVEVKEGASSKMIGWCLHGFNQHCILTTDIAGQPTSASQAAGKSFLRASHNLFHTFEKVVDCNSFKLEIVTTVRTPVK